MEIAALLFLFAYLTSNLQVELQHFHTISKFKYIISKHVFTLINLHLYFITKDPVVCQDSLVSKALLQIYQNTFS
jgi:hypothetical protein